MPIRTRIANAKNACKSVRRLTNESNGGRDLVYGQPRLLSHSSNATLLAVCASVSVRASGSDGELYRSSHALLAHVGRRDRSEIARSTWPCEPFGLLNYVALAKRASVIGVRMSKQAANGHNKLRPNPNRVESQIAQPKLTNLANLAQWASDSLTSRNKRQSSERVRGCRIRRMGSSSGHKQGWPSGRLSMGRAHR